MTEPTTSTSIGNEQGEIEKSAVTKDKNPAALRQEYDIGDTVKVGVLEHGVRRVKKMEVFRAELRRGKWKYQVKPSGGGLGEPLHRDENGNDWFAEDQLELG